MVINAKDSIMSKRQWRGHVTTCFPGAAGSRDVPGQVRWRDRHLLLWVISLCFAQETSEVKGD